MNGPRNPVTELRTAVPRRRRPPHEFAETLAKARALRTEHAHAAAYQAYRAQQARAAFHHTDAARWTEQYRHSVARCRVLGELIRVGGEKSTAPAATASTVSPLIRPEPVNALPTTGEAA